MSHPFQIVFRLIMFAGPLVNAADAEPLREVKVISGERQTDTERQLVQLLSNRIAERSGANVTIVSGSDLEESLVPKGLAIFFGIPERHRLLTELCREEGIELPTHRDPGGEGFALNSFLRGGGTVAVAAGVDQRGLLYAVGEILRQMSVSDVTIEFPGDLKLRTAPAFKVRGLIVAQGHTMRQLTGARAWTEEEWRRVVLDYALAGANTFTLGFSSGDAARFEFLKSYGLDALVSWSANIGSGPSEWRAVEAIGRQNYLCPSVPQARQALLDAWEERWRGGLPYDYLRIKSGDGGGCECDRCRPFGAVYVRLAEEMAQIVHKYSPDTNVFVANQKLDNAGDQAIFQYLNAAPRPWMSAFCYGPGSNAMGWMPGRRQDHRMDLFDHPGFGPHSRYLQEILHQLPPGIDIVMFSDLTHWVYSQYGLMDHELIPDRNHEVPPPWGHWLYDVRPHPALEMVYDRRTFFARPRHYHRIFQETMPYTIGDVAYSEGHHDHLNQWMWQRLLWSPHRTAEDIVLEYSRVWFGPAAAEKMVDVILQTELNITDSDDTQSEANRVVHLLRETGRQTPTGMMKSNYLWRQYLQKALLDQYIKQRYARQRIRERQIVSLLDKALRTGDMDQALVKTQALFDDDIETPQMKALRNEAGQLGEESDSIFGVRNVGYFNLDRDLIGMGWLKKQIKECQGRETDERRAILRSIVHYEDAGAGGFYDNAGEPGRASHLTHGWAYGDGEFAETNRPSQQSMAFTTDEQQGVTFEYKPLDREAAYRVRLTLVRPTFLPRYAVNQPQTTQSIFADDVCLAKDLELPEFESEFFEFDIPKEVTEDGELKLWFQKSDGVGEGPEPRRTVWRNTGGWGTLCSEVWLMKKK